MNNEADQIRARLRVLEEERRTLEPRLHEIEHVLSAPVKVSPPAGSVTNGSPAEEKVTLFRRHFSGRTDVFPLRWENPKTGKSGYALACANEWVRCVCCPNASLKRGGLGTKRGPRRVHFCNRMSLALNDRDPHHFPYQSWRCSASI